MPSEAKIGRRKVALITCQDYPNLTKDDQLVVPALEGHGFDVHIESWNSRATDWQKYDFCILRSCWDYHLRFEGFLGWLRSLAEQRINLWNPIPVVLWNLHKGYLKELKGRGVPAIETHWVEKGTNPNLKSILQAHRWEEVVIKPAISASAYQTYRVRGADAELRQSEFEEILRNSDALIQPFIPEVQINGEWSFVFWGEEFSHAVLRKPGGNEFRTQPEYGSILVSGPLRESWVREARRVVRAAPGPLLYARVDAIPVDDHLRIIELELIEPCLFFSNNGEAPWRFVQRLVALTDHGAKC